MTRKNLIAIAGFGSLALLLGAWGFQAAGFPPCEMCIWQRWPHAVAAFLALIGLMVPVAPIIVAGGLAALTTGGIGVFHAGVERGLWDGPSTCTSGDVSGLTTEELMNQIMNAPLVRCDEIAWQFLGISMAGWNAILSFGLAAVWFLAWRISAR